MSPKLNKHAKNLKCIPLMAEDSQNSVYSSTQNNQGFGRKGCTWERFTLTSCLSKYLSKDQRMGWRYHKMKSPSYRIVRVATIGLCYFLFWSTKGRCYFWLSIIGLQECFTMRSIRIGGLNLKGKQALLIMKLQCNQRKSLEHFTRKHLRLINSKAKIRIFLVESASTHCLITQDATTEIRHPHPSPFCILL